MKVQKNQKQHINGFSALLLFGLFAMCILAVLLIGGRTYRRLSERDHAAYTARTAAQYVATRVRQADAGDAVAVEEFGGGTALRLTEEIEGQTYVTRVYCYDGWLRELFAAADAEMTPADGEKVLEAASMTAQLTDSLLTVELDGQEIALHLRAGGAA